MILFKVLAFGLLLIIVPLSIWIEGRKKDKELINQIKHLTKDGCLLGSAIELMLLNNKIDNLYARFVKEFGLPLENFGVVKKSNDNYFISWGQDCDLNKAITTQIERVLKRNNARDDISIIHYNKLKFCIITPLLLEDKYSGLFVLMVVNKEKTSLWEDVLKRR